MAMARLFIRLNRYRYFCIVLPFPTPGRVKPFEYALAFRSSGPGSALKVCQPDLLFGPLKSIGLHDL